MVTKAYACSLFLTLAQAWNAVPLDKCSIISIPLEHLLDILLFLNPAEEKRVSALCISVLTAAFLCAVRWWESKANYCFVGMTLRYPEVLRY